jgi:betaine-aldehyde dehydrogenase
MTETLSYPDQHFWYDGQIQTSTSGHTFQTVNPATSQPLATIHTSSEEDIDAAIASAQTAFTSWPKTTPLYRSRILLKAVQILRDRNDELATIDTRDTGKPFSETSTVDVTTGADVLEYYAMMVASGGLNGETATLRNGEAWVYTKKEALGVCAAIGAWNYPLQIALWKCAPCLAAGNTLVYKPSEVTPLHALKLAEILAEAGLPRGVFNVVHGDGRVGGYLVGHEAIAKVSFTGQVSTGRKVAAAAGGGMKYVTMELGGKSPLLVLPDADVGEAVKGAMMANFYSSGQVCTNGTRVFVHEGMKKEFEVELLQQMKFVRMGDPMDPSTNFGPLSSLQHREKVLGYVNHGLLVDHAPLLTATGLQHKSPTDDEDWFPPLFPSGTDGPDFSFPPGFEIGAWCPPFIFTNCTDDMRIVREEIFGPVMCILSYSSVDEAISRANDTSLGLAAGVFTRDVDLAHKVVERLEAGITWINTWGESPAEMSVGGWGLSGLGVENGRRGLEAWTRSRSTLVEMGGKVATVFGPLE